MTEPKPTKTYLTTEVAKWLLERKTGATILEIAMHFNVSELSAQQAAERIRRNKQRYNYTWSGGRGRRGVGALPPKLRVLGINNLKLTSFQGGPRGQQFIATPVPGTESPVHQVRFFPSSISLSAEGFPRGSVYRAIAAGKPYAGYYWSRVKGVEHD